MPSTNPKTPKGWQRVRGHGGLAFVRTAGGLRVQKHAGEWLIFEWSYGQWRAWPDGYRTWWDAIQAANGGVE